MSLMSSSVIDQESRLPPMCRSRRLLNVSWTPLFVAEIPWVSRFSDKPHRIKKERRCFQTHSTRKGQSPDRLQADGIHASSIIPGVWTAHFTKACTIFWKHENVLCRKGGMKRQCVPASLLKTKGDRSRPRFTALPKPFARSCPCHLVLYF